MSESVKFLSWILIGFALLTLPYVCTVYAVGPIVRRFLSGNSKVIVAYLVTALILGLFIWAFVSWKNALDIRVPKAPFVIGVLIASFLIQRIREKDEIKEKNDNRVSSTTNDSA